MFEDVDIIDPEKIIVLHALNNVEQKPLRLGLDQFCDLLDRCTKRYGDPTRILGGPKMPVDEPKGKRK